MCAAVPTRSIFAFAVEETGVLHAVGRQGKAKLAVLCGFVAGARDSSGKRESIGITHKRK